MRWFWDFDNDDFAVSVSDDLAMDSDGDLMMRMGDNLAMDLDSGDLHLIFGWDDDEDD